MVQANKLQCRLHALRRAREQMPDSRCWGGLDTQPVHVTSRQSLISGQAVGWLPNIPAFPSQPSYKVGQIRLVDYRATQRVPGSGSFPIRPELAETRENRPASPSQLEPVIRFSPRRVLVSSIRWAELSVLRVGSPGAPHHSSYILSCRTIPSRAEMPGFCCRVDPPSRSNAFLLLAKVRSKFLDFLAAIKHPSVCVAVWSINISDIAALRRRDTGCSLPKLDVRSSFVENQSQSRCRILNIPPLWLLGRPFHIEMSREVSASSQVNHGRSCVESVVAQSSRHVVGICFIKVVISSIKETENQWQVSAVLVLERVLVMSERHFANGGIVRKPLYAAEMKNKRNSNEEKRVRIHMTHPPLNRSFLPVGALLRVLLNVKTQEKGKGKKIAAL